METEDMKKLPLEQRLVVAVVEFANSKKGTYKIERLAGRNVDIAYGKYLSLRVATKSGSFLAGIKIDDQKLVPPVFTTATPNGNYMKNSANI